MFTTEADRSRADWSLCREGAVHLFQDRAVLADACAALAGIDYAISTVDCGAGRAVLYEQMSDVLHWEEYIGPGYRWQGSLDALNDVMYAYPFGPSGRAALVLNGFDRLVADDAKFAWHILDIIEDRARGHLLEGKLLLALVQTDDLDYQPAPVGGRVPGWNVREWVRAE